MELQDKIALLLDLIHCSHHMDYWKYTPDGVLIRSTSNAEHMLDVLIKETGCFEYLQRNIGNAPLILAAQRDIRWIGVKEERDGEILFYHILGPFLIRRFQEPVAEAEVRLKNKNTTQLWLERLNECLTLLSVIPIQSYTQYAIMLHKLVNEKSVLETSINHQPPPVTMKLPESVKSKDNSKIKDRMQIYMAERSLLQAVREGDEDSAAAASLQTRKYVDRVREYTGNPLLDLKIGYTTFIAICTRAAIEGGLSPSVAYPLGDRYIKRIYQSNNQEHISELGNSMYHDFISHVHALRVNPSFSKAVQSCCDYIQLHSTEPLSIDVLAKRLGYSKYYLSALFKKETGCSVGDYIKIARIERAKVLLNNTDLNVENIWEEVGFSSRSVFGKAFRSVVGMTPREFRDQNIRL